MGNPTSYTCPECHGVLVRITEDKLSRFRCHTGHCYTDNALPESVMETSEEMLWQVIRSLEESVILLNEMGNNLKDAGDPKRAQIFFNKARALEEQSKTFHADTLKFEILSGDNLWHAGNQSEPNTSIDRTA